MVLYLINSTFEENHLKKTTRFSEVFDKTILNSGLLLWPNSKESACNEGDAGDAGSIPRSERSAGGGHGNPVQYSCLENPMDRGAWWATVHGVAKSQTWLKRLNTHIHVKFIGKIKYTRNSPGKFLEKIKWERTYFIKSSNRKFQKLKHFVAGLGYQGSTFE